MFRYHNHTADVLIEAEGKYIEEAFSEAAIGMFNLLTDITKITAEKPISINVKAETLEKLLFDFLDELIFLMDTEQMIFSKFEDMKITEDFTLECTAIGDTASKYETHGDIKAPTYNQMSIEKTTESYRIRFVVDI
ncbi:MAG: archease [Candidatus Woesearchaeota archaeon]|nr:archease [Candidatus Woesearchaeota archaeon]